MYIIKVNGSVIADNISSDIETAILSGTLKQEISKIESFEFTIAKGHLFYSSINFNDTVELYKDTECLFRGYVNNIKLNLRAQKTVVCEGLLGVFNMSVIRPHTRTYSNPAALLTQAIGWHNNQMNEAGVAGRTFTLGTVNITSPSIVFSSTDFLTVYDFIYKNVVKPIGGYLIYRYSGDTNYIDYLSDVTGSVIDQPVAPEVNLLDFSSKLLPDDFCTRFIPLGAKQSDGKRLVITSVNSGADHLDDATLMATYGSITAFEEFDDINDATNLKAVGEARFEQLKTIKNKLTINALDVSSVEDSYTDEMKFMSKVKIVDWYHGISAEAVVSAKTTDIVDNTNNKVTFEIEV